MSGKKKKLRLNCFFRELGFEVMCCRVNLITDWKRRRGRDRRETERGDGARPEKNIDTNIDIDTDTDSDTGKDNDDGISII